MDALSDLFRLEMIGQLHAVNTSPFVPFAVTRLRDHPGAVESRLAIDLRGIGNTPVSFRQLCLAWETENLPPLPPGVQDRVLTEWAALGVACAVVWLYAGLRIHAVAAQGDRFDYWVRQGEQDLALEVSGTMTGDVEARHQEKVQQLLDNPYGVDGYVVVVDFETRTVVFSFHRFPEAKS